METKRETHGASGLVCCECGATNCGILIGGQCGDCKAKDIGHEAWGKLNDAERTIIQAAFPGAGFPDVDWATKKAPDRLLEIAYRKAGRADPTLKSQCKNCGGSGIYNPTYVIPQCYKCNGRGVTYRKLETHLKQYVAALEGQAA